MTNIESDHKNKVSTSKDKLPTNTSLTPKEKEVVALLAKGHSYAEISNHLSITKNTLKTHIKRIYKKLKVRNRTQAILAVQEINQL
ncbi:helix-turn-helix transcriptional regulator [Candidatus Leptofilum sp.]|uniref:helix-turn-helix transcriptional regulator n=1 Tax=Candidatus Leptofilum sp. TaxID=3241576 RepID=UPI003B5907BA